MKIGDYARTKGGNIHKITDLKPFYENDKLIEDKQEVYIDNKSSGWNYEQFEEFIIKSSPNILDLIEVGDILYLEESDDIACMFFRDICLVKNEDNLLHIIDDIKNKKCELISILTKEQFERNEYKI